MQFLMHADDLHRTRFQNVLFNHWENIFYASYLAGLSVGQIQPIWYRKRKARNSFNCYETLKHNKSPTIYASPMVSTLYTFGNFWMRESNRRYNVLSRVTTSCWILMKMMMKLQWNVMEKCIFSILFKLSEKRWNKLIALWNYKCFFQVYKDFRKISVKYKITRNKPLATSLMKY